MVTMLRAPGGPIYICGMAWVRLSPRCSREVTHYAYALTAPHDVILTRRDSKRVSLNSQFTTVEVRESRAISFLTAHSELLVCSQPGYYPKP